MDLLIKILALCSMLVVFGGCFWLAWCSSDLSLRHSKSKNLGRKL